MRHGLISWTEEELSGADVERRQERLRAGMRAAGLDGLVIYLNHVRSAGAAWATGFTPYWSDGLWLLPLDGTPFTAVALSPRVGPWIRSTNPTSELAHSPRPGALIAERAASLGLSRLGVVELPRLPAGLFDEISAAEGIALSDATDLFARIRSAADAAEADLVARAADLARQAFAAVPERPATVGDATGAVELAARLGGAEEVYMAAAPDLSAETRFARVKGTTPAGARFALRATVARRGVWIRWARSFAPGAGAELAGTETWFADLTARLRARPGVGAEIAAAAPPRGLTLTGWRIEAPVGTWPLATVAETGADPADSHAVANLTACLDGPEGPMTFAGPLGGPLP